MRTVKRSKSLLGMFLMAVLLFAAAFCYRSSVMEVQAAQNGWVQKGTDWYYYKNGQMLTGWISSNGYKYYLDPADGKMATGFVTGRANTYYFNSGAEKPLGAMKTGWMKKDGDWYYFNAKGVMQNKGVIQVGNYKYYMQKNGKMLKGWKTGPVNKYYYLPAKDSKGRPEGSLLTSDWLEDNGEWYYFSGSGKMCKGVIDVGEYTYYMQSDGTMLTGWKKGPKNKYYYRTATDADGPKGSLVKGWKTIDGEKYYFSVNGIMATGERTMNGIRYIFDENGVLKETISNNGNAAVSSTRTIKSLLQNALLPIGQTLYVWGGGWNDGTRKGVSPTWKKWYDSQSGSYDYNNYRDLSTSTRAKGLDCSGYVGWVTYNALQKTSGVGSGYTCEASTVARTFAGYGWGKLLTQSTLSKNNYKYGTFKAGDMGSRAGHTWIVVGQCTDGSIVIAHSTPPCVQLAGSPTPNGSYSSQAITLAQNYMKKYYGATVAKFGLNSSTSMTCLNASNVMRWDVSGNKMMTDPDGYMNKTANAILADLFS